VRAPQTAILTAQEAEKNQQRRRSLVELIGTGEAVALVGAGCSHAAGFPLWNGFLDEMERFASRLTPPFAPDPVLRHANMLAYAERIYEHCAHHGHGDRYHGWLQAQFDRQFLVPRLTRWLVTLPFRAFLTTNYEFVLEAGLREERGDCVSVDVQEDTPLTVARAMRSVALPGGGVGVIHLHGTGRFPWRMVVNESDYTRAYGYPLVGEPGSGQEALDPTTPTQRLTFALLATRPIVFVGYGFADDFLGEVLSRATRAGWAWEQGFHIAVMPIEAGTADETRVAAERLRTDNGVDTVFYEVHSRNFDVLADVIEAFAIELGLTLRSESLRKITPAAEQCVRAALADGVQVPEGGPYGPRGQWSRGLTTRNAERALRQATPESETDGLGAKNQDLGDRNAD
jgi:hypothetical protein